MNDQMSEVTTMNVPSSLLSTCQTQGTSQDARQTVSIQAKSPPAPALEAGATVFVGTSAPADAAPAWRIPEVQTYNDYESQSTQATHVVKIKINPDESGKVISTVRVTLDENRNDSSTLQRLTEKDGVIVNVPNVVNNRASDCCVRISVGNNEADQHREDMVQRGTSEPLNSSSINRTNSCFYYGTFQSSLGGMVMSSGQCSPSDTLDSGTCSDLDGTPPPLPKKKSASTVILSSGQHNRTGSLTSSGAEIDSDDNESSISCDSLNSGELHMKSEENSREDKIDFHKGQSQKYDDQQKVCEVSPNPEFASLNKENSGFFAELNSSVCSSMESPTVSPSPSETSSLSKASTTPRVRSPELLEIKRLSTIVKECTYEERKREHERIEQEVAAAEFYANYNRGNGSKYVYDDDRFYKFHLNEHSEEKQTAEFNLEDKGRDEYFAGYKMLDREAIRSAKGTVRGVKNRVRAGIATFLQKPSTKNYKAKDAGKVVVYTTTMGIVRETYYACMKVKQILRTHMVKYEERDMFMSTESQMELRDRIGCTTIQVPQLFIDGEYIGDVEAVERLNESGELRHLLKPFKSLDSCTTCKICGGYRLLPCTVCNGSKKSVHRNDFTTEFVALKCMNCDEVGLVRCQNC